MDGFTQEASRNPGSRGGGTGLTRRGTERGSVVIASVIFMFLFLMVAGFGVDLARYFVLQQRTQTIADEAVLSSAQQLNQVRTLEELDRARILRGALRYIQQKDGYSDDVYDYTVEMTGGDIQSARFSPDATHPDTYYRIGINVKHAFEPYFLPRGIFGDHYSAIQAQAVAEAVPVFSEHNLYDPWVPGPPIPPLRYAVYSRLDIKPEDFNLSGCFTVNGDMHADSGYVRLEEMEAPDACGPGEGQVKLNGKVEAGDPDDIGSDCTGKQPDPGCISFENVDGDVLDDLLYPNGIVSQNGPTEHGDRLNVDPGGIVIPTPPTPAEDPDQYPGPVCIVDAGGGVQTVSSPGDLVGGGEDCSDGGTFYVQNGDMKVQHFTMRGDYSLVADGHVTFSDVGAMTSHDMFVMSVEKWIKFQNINTDLDLNATFYTPNGNVHGQCDPVQEGCIKFEEAGSNSIRINGGLVAGTLAKFETMDDLTINFQGHVDRLPGGLRVFVKPNNVPDYWKINLID